MLLVTNFSNTSGTVNIFQSNASTPGAGVTNCNVLTATPSACSNGQYNVSGFLYSQSPPSSGSVTITNSCNGQSLTFNAPFSTNLAYSFNNLCGNGQPCQITAPYSGYIHSSFVRYDYGNPLGLHRQYVYCNGQCYRCVSTSVRFIDGHYFMRGFCRYHYFSC
jgi:hypothetical protein